MTPDTEPAPSRRDYFATTHWTVVLRAGRHASPQSDSALEELCRAYWYPIYTYIRRQGHAREDAEDLTQAFFVRFLAKNFLQQVDSTKGRFRAFLLASVKHFLANERDRSNSQKRGGGVAHLSLDWDDAETRYRIEPADNLSPDKLYDRTWALTLLEGVISRLRDESRVDNRAELFEQLKPCLMGKGNIDYSQSAAALGMSEGAVRVAVHRLRQRYRAVLREQIAQTLGDPDQIEDELRSLFSALA